MNRNRAMDILNTLPLSKIKSDCLKIREAGFGKKVNLCAIINAKNGACSENCTFCAQAGSDGEAILSADYILAAHKSHSEAGVQRFSTVTSGRKLSGDDFEHICKVASLGKDYSPMCASLGILTLSELRTLKESGISRYHHNLETSASFFPSICTTHSWKQRAQTVSNAKLAGMSVCSGGIMGIGESDEDRIDLAFSLRELQVDSIAINFYVPVEGATVNAEKLSKEKMLRIIGMLRLVNPEAELRICAGRFLFGEVEKDIFSFGITGIMTGCLLTTEGSQLEKDYELINEAGYLI